MDMGVIKQDSYPTTHNLLMSCTIRVLKHLGCPHGCSESIRAPQADFGRSQSQTILSKLYRASSKQFSDFLRRMIREQPIPEILDFFHAYVGFCIDPSSLLSPLSKSEFYYLLLFLDYSKFVNIIKL